MGHRGSPDPAHYATVTSEALTKAITRGRSRISRKVSVIVSGAGWKKRSHQNLARIADAFREVGLYLDSDIVDMKLSRGHRVWFSFAPFPVRSLGQSFVAETHLKSFLMEHYKVAFAGIRDLEGLTLIKPEYRVEYAGDERFVDLVFKDTDGALVAVELEVEGPKDESVPQLRRYMRGLKRDASSIRGVLITARPEGAQLEEDTIELLETLGNEFRVCWYWYNANVTLSGIV